MHVLGSRSRPRGWQDGRKSITKVDASHSSDDLQRAYTWTGKLEAS